MHVTCKLSFLSSTARLVLGSDHLIFMAGRGAGMIIMVLEFVFFRN